MEEGAHTAAVMEAITEQAVLAVLARFVSSGPATLVASHQQIREIYK
jgi:hypothetical protein